MRTAVELDFADGKYTFRLTLEGINEIQRKCKAGIGAVYARVLSGRYFHPELSGAAFGNPAEGRYTAEDLLEIIRQGLIGGGSGYADGKKVEVDAHTANALIVNYVFPARPIKVAWDLAAAIIMASYEGMDDIEEHPVKKKSEKTSEEEAGSTTAGRSRTSPSATSRRSKRGK